MYRLRISLRSAASMAGISAGRPTPFRGRSYLDSGIGLDLAEKAVQKPDIALWILHVGHVRAARQDHRTGPGDALSDRPVDRRRRLVVLARGDERRHSDLPETLGDVPLAQRAGDVEFAWPVHRPVDEPVPLDEVERAQHILGPLVQTADVPLVEDQAGVLVLLQIGRPRLLVPAQRLLHIFRELGAETTRLGDPLRNARRRARQDEARKAGRLRERVLHGEHPAPRAPEEVDPVEPELAPDGADLVHEQLDRVEGRILGEIGLPAAELVVEDRAPARPGERLERLEVVMRRTRPAVEEQHGELPSLLRVADDAVPDLVAAKGQPPLDRAHEWGTGLELISKLSTGRLAPLDGAMRRPQSPP